MGCSSTFWYFLKFGIFILVLTGAAAHGQTQSLDQLKETCDDTRSPKSASRACYAVLNSRDAETDDKVQAYESLALIASMQGNYNDALDAVNAAMRIDSRSCTLFVARGTVQWSLNRVDAAIQDFTQANSYSKDGFCEDSAQEPLEQRGNLYFWQGDYQRAAADYNQTLQHVHMASKDLPILLFLANRHLGRNDADTLKASFTKLLADKQIAKSLYWTSFDDAIRSTLLEEGDREALLAAAQSSDPEKNASRFAKAYFVLAEIEALRGDFNTARKDYTSAEQFDPNGIGIIAKAQNSRLPAASTLRESTQGGVVSRPIPPAGNYYALVIGISAYPGSLRLETPRADATAVADLLQQRFGFEVKELLDSQATRTAIIRSIKDYRNQLRPEDSLLIYYAGHGQSDVQTGKAYWIPVDADSSDNPNAIIADDITASLAAQAANHVLVISDSCYSGDMTRDPNFPVPATVTAAYLQQMQARKSRTLMASGGNEPVSDGGGNGHSIFAAALLKALGDGEASSFTAGQLFFSQIQQPVGGRSHQVPQYEYLRASGHDGGDFVFVRR